MASVLKIIAKFSSSQILTLYIGVSGVLMEVMDFKARLGGGEMEAQGHQSHGRAEMQSHSPSYRRKWREESRKVGNYEARQKEK